MTRALVLAALILATCSRGVRAQEFAAPGPPWGETPASLLERGTPARAPRAGFQAIAVRWFGLAELATASVGLSGGWRGCRGAIGISHTGESDLGWSAVALAGGWADAKAGAALRAVARAEPRSAGAPRRGIEAGVGAWAEAAPGARIWVSAPQLWTDGEAPPLERRLEIGLVARVLDLDVWLSRATAPGAPRGLRGEHAAGVLARAGLLALWTEVRDQPSRGAFGAAISWKGLLVSFQVDGHPLLGETIKLGLSAAREAP